MARYLARYGRNSFSSVVTIESTENVDNHTVYVIKVVLDQFSWTVRRRYSEFNELHSKLVSVWGLEKTLLPPKKIFGNQAKHFVEKRQQQLEAYLQAIFQIHPELPEPVAKFLDLDLYEIHGISQSLAIQLFLKGEYLLEADYVFETGPLQLHAVTERLKLPEPPCESGDKRKDVSHTVDFFSNVQQLRVVGSQDCVGTSNLVPNQLSFELTRFKNVKRLWVIDCNPRMMTGVGSIRTTVSYLEVRNSLQTLKEILLCDVVHSDEHYSNSTFEWTSVTEANFRHNNIAVVDDSVRLIRNVEKLDIGNNHLTTVPNLSHLHSLDRLDLGHNCIRDLPQLHTCLGNIRYLCLSGNRIESLHGICKLYSLEVLDLSYNDVSNLAELVSVAALPCIENLDLTANPVALTVDYRVKVLALFKSRAGEVCLDNEKANRVELDTAAVLNAMQTSVSQVVNCRTDCNNCVTLK